MEKNDRKFMCYRLPSKKDFDTSPTALPTIQVYWAASFCVGDVIVKHVSFRSPPMYFALSMGIGFPFFFQEMRVTAGESLVTSTL